MCYSNESTIMLIIVWRVRSYDFYQSGWSLLSFIYFHGDANQWGVIHNKTTDKKRTQKLQYNVYANWFPLTVGALLFSSMCLAGTSVFAIGLYFKGGSAMFPIFLLGRILFGWVNRVVF